MADSTHTVHSNTTQVASSNIPVFRDTTCRQLYRYRRFWGICCRHLCVCPGTLDCTADGGSRPVTNVSAQMPICTVQHLSRLMSHQFRSNSLKSCTVKLSFILSPLLKTPPFFVSSFVFHFLLLHFYSFLFIPSKHRPFPVSLMISSIALFEASFFIKRITACVSLLNLPSKYQVSTSPLLPSSRQGSHSSSQTYTPRASVWHSTASESRQHESRSFRPAACSGTTLLQCRWKLHTPFCNQTVSESGNRHVRSSEPATFVS